MIPAYGECIGRIGGPVAAYAVTEMADSFKRSTERCGVLVATTRKGVITEMRTRFGAVSIVVHDMAKSLAFYRELGLDIPTDADQQSHVDIELPGGIMLLWDTVETVRTMDPEWQPPQGGHRMALAFRCDTPAEVDQAYARLTELGYTGNLAPWDAFWGQRYAVVRDPDDNPVDLFSPNT